MKTNYRIVKNGNNVYSIQKYDRLYGNERYWRTIIFNLDHLQQALNKLDDLERDSKETVVHVREF